MLEKILDKLLFIAPINAAIIAVLLLWLIATYGYGCCLMAYVRKRYALPSFLLESSAIMWLCSFCMGLSVLCFVVAVWHFFFPLFGALSVVLALLGVVLFYCYGRQFFTLDTTSIIALCLALLIVLPVSLLSDSMGDSVNYHIQAITWMQESPLVFGLGNVHSRLGYNGFFYGYYALTDVAQFIPHAYMHLRSFVANEIVYCAFLISAFFCVIKLMKNKSLPFSELFLALALIPFFLILRWGEFRGLYVEGVGAVLGIMLFAMLFLLLMQYISLAGGGGGIY